MSLTVNDKGGGADFELLEAGTHAAVCTMIVDIGPQETAWGEKDKIKLRFEVPAERASWKDKEGNEHEGPMVIWGTYTASLNEKATLRQHLEAWRGVPFTEVERMGFHLKNILGKRCMISLIHKESGGNTYANITSTSKLTKGMALTQPEGELVSFDFDQYTQAHLGQLPEWLQKRVADGKALLAAQRGRAETPAQPSNDIDSDDIPF